MSNKTSFLGLSLLDTSSENSTHFKDWSRNINLEGDEDHKSDFQKIDEFAQKITKDIEERPAGVSSWNDLTDKPFYDEGGLEPITWDGVRKENDIYFMQPEVYTLVKVSDLTPSIDDLIGSTAGNESGAAVISSDMLGEITDNDGGNVGVGIYGYLAVIYKQTDIYSWSVEPGTYFGYVDSDETVLTTFLTFPGGTIKTLDEKFIPDTIARKADVVVEWGKF